MNDRQVAALEREIFWNTHVRDQSKDPKQKGRCNERILMFMMQIADFEREANEIKLDRGAREHAAWYSTTAET